MIKVKNKFSTLCLFFCGVAMILAPLGYSGEVSAIAADAEEITVTYPYYGFVEDPEHPWTSVYDALDETDTVNYSDAFFDVASPGDHPGLRAASYALALAGFENLNDGYPTNSTIPNPKLTNMLDQMGFSDYQSWDTYSEIDGHSMGTTIGRKVLPGGQDLIVVAPRNYNYMTEWLSNLNIGTAGDHVGFAESANFIKERFDEYLAGRDVSNYKLWVVGYSRGGAVVDLFAKNINANIGNYSLAPNDLYAYTFGAPKASITKTGYSNIHDVKDGNDLLLGYVFPEVWGFYNTGTYEEVHPADLEIATSVVNISGLIDNARVLSLLTSNEELAEAVGAMNGGEFMDAWTEFVTENGLTREYFDTEVKVPLSNIVQAYQLRTLDKQAEFIDFFINTDNGLAAMVVMNVFRDLLSDAYGDGTLEERLSVFSPYQDLVKILKGTAVEADIDEFVSYLVRYMGNYVDYEDVFGEPPVVTMAEFDTIKEDAPKVVKALAPVITADAKYTQEKFGENYSLFYTYTLASNARDLVMGHIPESFMPILKGLIVADEEEAVEEAVVIPRAPNAGAR